MKIDLIAGALWPIQGMPKFLQIIAYMTPFTFSVNALRKIGYKDSTISDFDVQMTFAVLLLWTSIMISLVIVLLKRKS